MIKWTFKVLHIFILYNRTYETGLSDVWIIYIILGMVSSNSRSINGPASISTYLEQINLVVNPRMSPARIV